MEITFSDSFYVLNIFYHRSQWHMLNILNYALKYQERNSSTIPENDKTALLTSFHPDCTLKGGIIFISHLQICSQLKILFGYKVTLFFS